MSDDMGYIQKDLREHAVDVDDLREDPANANTHPEKNLQSIADSLDEFGQRQVIVAREDGTVIAGNGRLRAAKERLGWGKIACIFVDDDEVEAARFAIADNRTAELAKWDDEGLGDMLEAIDDSPPGFDDEDVGELLDEVDGDDGVEGDPDAEIDRAKELREEWGTERGQLWVLRCPESGREHRLLCGDSTDEGDVDRLLEGNDPAMMWSDPPYGIGFQSNHRYESSTFDRIEGDEKPLVEYLPHCTDIPVWYVCCRWDVAPTFMNAIAEHGYRTRNWIVWHKPAGGMGDLEAQYKPTHETILYASSERKPLLSGTRHDDVWKVNRDDVNDYDHPTQKPVKLGERAMANHAPVGGVVYDPFAGSGMSIIAAQNHGAECYAVEMEPKYCAVILERCGAMGLEPELIDDE